MAIYRHKGHQEMPSTTRRIFRGYRGQSNHPHKLSTELREEYSKSGRPNLYVSVGGYQISKDSVTITKEGKTSKEEKRERDDSPSTE